MLRRVSDENRMKREDFKEENKRIFTVRLGDYFENCTDPDTKVEVNEEVYESLRKEKQDDMEFRKEQVSHYVPQDLETVISEGKARMYTLSPEEEFGARQKLREAFGMVDEARDQYRLYTEYIRELERGNAGDKEHISRTAMRVGFRRSGR